LIYSIELFQLILLTLIFLLYCTDKNTLSRTIFLGNVFVILFRELGTFNVELLADYLKNYFSSLYTLYIQNIYERFKKLLILIY